ncbi:MAG TPA: amidohydrolase family protein [Bryobacteraceae bacterium]|nr:amidohydrolase family protein [Bryobacteraceae bacterium]
MITKQPQTEPAEETAPAGTRKYRIIDPHVHVWINDPRYPWAKETANPPAKDRSPEMLLDLMRANGVEKTVIVQVIHYRWDNRFAADTLKKYPQYFMGIARVNPESPAAPDDLSRLVEEDGFHGVRISPSADASSDWIRGPLMPPLWKRAEELKVPMTVLTPVTRMPDLQPLIEPRTNLDVVIDHMADSPIDQPAELDKLIALARYPRVFVKISHTWSLSKQDYPYTDTFEQVKRLYDAFGPQRLMWGTDWPLVEERCGYAKALSLVRDEMKFLNEEDKSWILSRTIERVWPFD